MNRNIIMELKHLENGQVEVEGKVYNLPNSMTSVNGIPEDMLMLRILKDLYGDQFSHSEAYRVGCKQLIDTHDDNLEAMKAERDDAIQSRDALTMKIKRLDDSIHEKESTEQVEVKESREQFEHIVSEFERLAYPVSVEGKKYPLSHLVGLHKSLNENMVLSIYANATPAGKMVPDAFMLREMLEKCLL